MRVCVVCGRESPEGFRFCGSCGASLAAEAPTLVIDVMVERRIAFMERLGLEELLHPAPSGSAA